mmetsp:Transcript_43765/g.124796  ORF Transcript_43765/g.124796 Transcript_43765/m.124796 type:complete len:269 (-) Transcript_43765:8-814(-)
MLGLFCRLLGLLLEHSRLLLGLVGLAPALLRLLRGTLRGLALLCCPLVGLLGLLPPRLRRGFRALHARLGLRLRRDLLLGPRRSELADAVTLGPALAGAPLAAAVPARGRATAAPTLAAVPPGLRPGPPRILATWRALPRARAGPVALLVLPVLLPAPALRAPLAVAPVPIAALVTAVALALAAVPLALAALPLALLLAALTLLLAALALALAAGARAEAAAAGGPALERGPQRGLGALHGAGLRGHGAPGGSAPGPPGGGAADPAAA